MNAAASSGALKSFSGVELQGAGAVTNHFAGMVNAMFVNANVYSYAGDPEKTKISYIEFAPGAFYPIDKQRKMIVELYGGYGVGHVRNEYDLSSNSIVKFGKVFIQPNVGFKSRYFDIAFVPKVSFVNWKLVSTHFPAGVNSSTATELMQIQSEKRFTAFEPAIVTRVGYELVKIQFTHSFSHPSKEQLSNLMETYTSSIGIHIDLGVWNKLKSKK